MVFQLTLKGFKACCCTSVKSTQAGFEVDAGTAGFSGPVTLDLLALIALLEDGLDAATAVDAASVICAKPCKGKTARTKTTRTCFICCVKYSKIGKRFLGLLNSRFSD